MKPEAKPKPLKLKPVIYSSIPKYPTNVQFDRNDIFKMIPKRWQDSKIAGVLFSTIFISTMLSGCSESDNSTSPTSKISTPSPAATANVTAVTNTPTTIAPTIAPTKVPTKVPTKTPTKTPKINAPTRNAPTSTDKVLSKIAPVFQAGDGFVSYGDLGEAVYYAFTEKEGLEFIKTALENQNIQIENSNKNLPEIQLPLQGSVAYDNSQTGIKYPFEFDAVVHGKNQDVFIEFISREDEDITGEDPNNGFSNTFTKKGAYILQAELKAYGDNNAINAAVIYDPIGDTEDQSQVELQEQIQQFISWMKAEGII